MTPEELRQEIRERVAVHSATGLGLMATLWIVVSIRTEGLDDERTAAWVRAAREVEAETAADEDADDDVNDAGRARPWLLTAVLAMAVAIAAGALLLIPAGDGWECPGRVINDVCWTSGVDR